MSFLRRFILHSPKRYLFAVLLGAVIGTLVLLRDGTDQLIYFADAFGSAGGILFFLGLLDMVTYFGAFDTFGYAFSTLGKRRYKDLYDYTEAKKEKRSHQELGFMPFIVVGIVFIAVSLLLSAELPH